MFSVFGKEIYSYGVLVAAGFLAAILTWGWLGRRERRPPGFAADLGFWLMASGIVGSRLAYVAANWSYYRAAPLEIIRIDQGGLIFYGGFLLACAALALFARHHRLPLWYAADFAIPGLAIGHALGRLGCFFNGCCYGRPAGDSPFGIAYPAVCEPGKLFAGIPLYPVQLIESACLIVLWAVLLFAHPRRYKDGAVFALYLLLYPPCRFLLEYLRGDERQSWLVLDVAQATSIALFLAGVLLFALLPRRRFIP
ncbi:MAG TPA: prolipoprotein diacylglyceryl transferase, partial [Verrucomicrobia bacterium]|nr:prolipoprotein diacylglyceryl transferase [Verrucomicrobiota bacterium]